MDPAKALLLVVFLVFLPLCPVLVLLAESSYYQVEFNAVEWVAWIAFFAATYLLWMTLVTGLVDYGVRRFGRLTEKQMDKEDAIVGSIIVPSYTAVVLLVGVFSAIPAWVRQLDVLIGIVSPVLWGIGFFKKDGLFRLLSRSIFVAWAVGVVLSFANTQFFPEVFAAKRTPFVLGLAYLGMASLAAMYCFSMTIFMIRYGVMGIDVAFLGRNLEDYVEALVKQLKSQEVNLEIERRSVSADQYGNFVYNVWSHYREALWGIGDWILSKPEREVSVIIYKPTVFFPLDEIIEFSNEHLRNLYSELKLSKEELLRHILRTDEERQVYEMSDGRSADEIASKIGVDRETVLDLWQRWRRIPIVRSKFADGKVAVKMIPHCDSRERTGQLGQH